MFPLTSWIASAAQSSPAPRGMRSGWRAGLALWSALLIVAAAQLDARSDRTAGEEDTTIETFITSHRAGAPSAGSPHGRAHGARSAQVRPLPSSRAVPGLKMTVVRVEWRLPCLSCVLESGGLRPSFVHGDLADGWITVTGSRCAQPAAGRPLEVDEQGAAWRAPYVHAADASKQAAEAANQQGEQG